MHCHVEAGHCDRPRSLEHLARGLRVMPHVRLRYRADVSRLGGGAAHYNHALEERRQFRLLHERERYICERPHRNERHLTGILPCQAHDLVRCMLPAWLEAGKLHVRVAQAVLAVNELRHLQRAQQRPVGADRHGDLRAPG